MEKNFLVYNPITLIDEVKARPELYQPDRIDRSDRLQLWKEVGAALFQDWDQCNKATVYGRVLHLQKKWKSLRDAYNRELRIRKSSTNRSRCVYRYFKRMSFLGGFEGPVSSDDESEKQTLQYIQTLDDENDTERNMKQETIETQSNSLEYGEPTYTKTKKSKKKKLKRQKPEESRCHDDVDVEDDIPIDNDDLEISAYPFEFSGEPENDGDKLFLLSFLPEMRQLPSHIKMWARAQIANVMQEAVTSNVNNTRPGMSMDNIDNVVKKY